MYTDFYSFHDEVTFDVSFNAHYNLKFKNEFSISYHGLTFSSYCKNCYIVPRTDDLSSCYMMKKRAPNNSFVYVLYSDKRYSFTLNNEFSTSFEKWLSQFPISVNLED